MVKKEVIRLSTSPKKFFYNPLYKLDKSNMGQKKSFVKSREQRAKEALTCLKIARHEPKLGLLLDLGCGRGYLTKYFLKQGIKAIGVDVLKIKFVKRNIRLGSFIRANGIRLPLRDDCFHTIILNDVLEHIPYNIAHSLLIEAKRILKIDGKIYISVANRYQIREPHTGIPFLTWLPKRFWNAIFYRLTKGKRLIYSYYPYTIKDLKKLTKTVGFKCINYTWFYAWNKVSNVELIGDSLLRFAIKIIKRIGLSKLAYIITKKFSVILFICQRR